MKENYKPFANAGDWPAAGGLLAAAVSFFALPWLGVTANIDPLGYKLFNGEVKSVSLLQLPWYWTAMLFVTWVAVAAFLLLPRSRGGVSLGVGGLYAAFAIVFFFGAWYKLHVVVGDIASILKGVPYIGGKLADMFEQATRNIVGLRVKSGYFLFIAAAVLLIAGGAVRLWTGRSAAP